MNESFRIPEYDSFLKENFIQFIQYKKSTGRKEKLYATVLKTFDSYCLNNQLSTQSLDKKTVNGFLQVTGSRKLSSVHTYASVLRELGNFMNEVQGIKDVYITQAHGNRKSDYTPYIFSEEEISALLKQASSFQLCNSRINPNMRNVVSCLYAMLYCTGMRVSEALGLKLEDVSLDECIIIVTETKNDKQRLIPITESLAMRCRAYLRQKVSVHNIYFFDSGSDCRYGRIDKKQAYRFFRKLLECSGIPHRGKGEGPRLHDFRSTFAVHSLQKLGNLDGDINAYLEYLSLYMGHQSIYETQDYLWLTDELVADMLEKTSADTAFMSEEFNWRAVNIDV